MKKESSLHKNNKAPTPIGLVDKDKQFQQNSLLIGKMFANMVQSVDLGTNVKSNLPKNYAGGFKQSNKSIQNEQRLAINNISIKPQDNISISRPTKLTVYDEFGLINDSIGKNNSKSKPKYRQNQISKSKYRQQQPDNPVQIQQSMFDEMKNNRKKQLQKVLNNNYVNLHEYYQIANQNNRQQTVVHIRSSLQNMTIQNVQSKLQAHRRELKAIQDQYKLKKSSLNHNNYSQLTKKSPQKVFVNSKENDPYKAYGKTQAQIYEMIKKNRKDDEKQLEMDKLWQQKINQNPKIAQYSQKYQQYLVQKDAKNLLYGAVRNKLYKWDKFTQPQHQKSKLKPPTKVSKQKSITKQNKSLQKNQQINLTNSLINSQNISQVLASKDDKFIAKYIFAQVDVDKKGLLSKQELLQYITKNQHIIKSYNIDLKWIYTDLDNFSTKRKGMLNKQQLGVFLATFQRLQHPQIKLTNISELNKSSTSPKKQNNKNSVAFEVLFSINAYRFRKLFQTLDLNDDKLLKREQFIQNIFIDSECSKILDEVVIKIKIIDKRITYRQMIGFILDDYRKQKNQKLKKSKEYITFDRFCQYFQLPETINLKYFNKKNNKIDTITNEHQIFDIQTQNLNILKDIFDTIPRVYQDYIVTADFIQTALMDPLVLSFQQDMSRIQSVQTNLPIETLRLTLQRMIKQSDQYIDWETARYFFSRRGRPLNWNIDLINKKKDVRQQKRTQSINETLKKQLILKNQFQLSNQLKSQYINKKKIKSQNNYTIPQPFKITDQNKKKQNKKQVQDGQKQFNEINQFKAKPVNKQILQSKPDLIQGKRTTSIKKNQYNYQNYQNDRIERALKRAQQQFKLEEQKKKIKQQTDIKSWIDALNIVKEVKKNIKPKQDNRHNSRLKQDKPKISVSQQKVVNRLFQKPDIMQNVVKQQKKRQQVIKANQQNKSKIKKQIAQKNKINQQKSKNIKQQQEKQQQKINKATNDASFHPKINKKKSLSPASQQAIDKCKQVRQKKKKQQLMKFIQAQEIRKKKINQWQYKDPYVKIKELKSQQQIFQNIFNINILQQFLMEQDKRSFEKDHQFNNKNKKQRQIYLKGVSNKFKILMDQQKNIIDQMKIKQKQNIIKNQPIKSNPIISTVQPKYKTDLNFHASKALRRYRAIIDGTSASQVPSQFDQYTQNQIKNNEDQEF